MTPDHRIVAQHITGVSRVRGEWPAIAFALIDEPSVTKWYLIDDQTLTQLSDPTVAFSPTMVFEANVGLIYQAVRYTDRAWSRPLINGHLPILPQDLARARKQSAAR